MVIRKGGDNFSRRSGDFYPVKRVSSYDVLGDEPGEEYPDAAQVAINGMSREALILGVVKAVVRETPLLFQVKDERPDFLASDSCYVCACFLKGEKVLKVVNAISDDVYGTGAFTFRNGTELITSEEATYVRARF